MKLHLWISKILYLSLNTSHKSQKQLPATMLTKFLSVVLEEWVKRTFCIFLTFVPNKKVGTLKKII